jgi:ACS family hexuronate transporter-like MFS transporter
MMLVSVISYIDRNTLALLAPTILRETNLSAEQYGFIISAFSIAYMVGNPAWGVILDRIGVRRGMILAVATWTFASMSHAFAIGFRSFAVARAILGFGEGATFPGSMRTVMQTLPVEHRSRGIAVSYSGGSFGAIITPLVITPIAAIWGWRGAFWFTGGIGALWLLHWAVLSRRKDLARTVPPSQPGSSAGDILRWNQARVWAFIVAYALGALPLGFVLYETSLYLSAVLHKTQVQIGAVLWIPPLGWEVGYFFWGWFTDRTRSGASLEGSRRLFLFLTVLSLPLAAVPRIDSFALAMALLFFAMFVSAGFIIGSLAYANSYYSVKHAGLIAGLGAGSWSALLAVVMPGFGRLFDLHLYSAAFLAASLVPAAGCLIWWILSQREAAIKREYARVI